MIIKNVQILQDEGWKKGNVLIKGSRIVLCDLSGKKAEKRQGPVIQGRGNRLVPGMIDIHFNGMEKIDCICPGEKALEKLETKLLARGITGYLPTIYSVSYSALKKNLNIYRKYMTARIGKTIVLGLNLEGPFLNLSQAGAHDKRYLRDFSDKKYIDLIREFRDIIKVITVAPELPQAKRYIRIFSGWGIRVMLGHTLADYRQSVSAIDAGALGITHLFNRTTPFHHRDVGIVGAAFLDKRVFVELIADGLHCSMEAVRMAMGSICHKRIILVSDMIATPAKARLVRGTEGCRGYMDGRDIFLGGASHLLSNVRNMLHGLHLDMGTVWKFVSENPAAFLGLKASLGRIRKGMKADLLIVDKDCKIKNVIKSGELICAE